jgi:predicted dehydrogenase
MLKIGVVGTGHLGKIHLNCIKQIPDYNLIGFYDLDPDVRKNIAETYQIKAFDSYEELLDAVDVIDIITPTTVHFEHASLAMRKFKHVFIEKPIVATSEEARMLISLSHEANVKVQVGHVERLNPAFVAVRSKIQNPMFIECHRLATYNPRGTDVPVVLDLMIHDIDVVLSTVKSPIKRIHANGVAIVSETVDIANARIEFENGAVANLTASRISLNNMRKTRFFQQNAYISVDFLNKKSEVISITDETENSADKKSITLNVANGKTKCLTIDSPEIIPTNAIQQELELFCQSIMENTTPLVSISDGGDALQVAQQIMKKIMTH